MTRRKQLQEEYLAEKDRRETEKLYKKANRKYNSDVRFFTVFRVGDKFKNVYNEDTITIAELSKFDRHSNRKGKVPNANPELKHLNQILIGNENVEETVKMYLEGVKIRNNSVVAREIILSAGRGFWEKLSDEDRERWKETNIKFLKDNFGDNCVYAVLHMDETTPHIHALIVPVFYNEKRKVATLNNSFYFGDKGKLSAWQDKYTNILTDNFQNIFKRGIRGSKATHIDLKTFYALINENLDELNSEVVIAHAKENFINRKKVEELQNTLEEQEIKLQLIGEIIKNNKELKDDVRLYEYTIKSLADKYNIPKNEVFKIMSNKEKDDNKTKQRER